MKTKVWLLTGFSLLIFGTQFLSAQNTSKPYEDGFLQRFGVAAKLGTYGPGIDFHTSLLPNLKARVGINYAPYSLSGDYDFEPDAPDESGTVNASITSFDMKFINANVLVDFYPVKSGIFCLTAGAYIGNNQISMAGKADEEFVLDDIVIKPGANGVYDAKLKLGDAFKPYFGIGLGRTISNSRVGFRFDLGVVYQGDYVVESDYIDSNNLSQKFSSNSDLPVSDEVMKLWPMISFSLSYRIK